jgi:Uma2 family endonuclease
MVVKQKSQPLTVNKFFETYPDACNQLVELIDGAMAVTASPRDLHEYISVKLTILLGGYIYTNRLGEFRTSPNGFILDDYNIVKPDLAFIKKYSSTCKLGKDGYWHGTPDLIVEITSTSSVRQDRVKKSDLYARHGVREYWLIEPDARYLEVYTLEDGAFTLFGDYGKTDTIISPIFSNMEIKIPDIFPPKL